MILLSIIYYKIRIAEAFVWMLVCAGLLKIQLLIFKRIEALNPNPPAKPAKKYLNSPETLHRN